MKKPAILIIFLLFSVNATAFEYDIPLKNARMEERAKALFPEIKCMVCDGQALSSSNSEFAQNLRGFVRKQIKEGRTNEEIKEFLVQRYGEAVLLSPRIIWQNALLWLLPFGLLAGGITFVLIRAKKA